MKYIRIILLFFVTSLSAQNKGTVVYQLIPRALEEFIGDGEIAPDLKEMYKAFNNEKKNIKFTLSFKGDESFFELIEVLPTQVINQRAYQAILEGTFGTNKFYTNKKEKIFLQDNTEAGRLLLSYNFDDIKWQITNETKKIDGFLCYKAVTKWRVRSAQGSSLTPVTAWFCPEIPLPFGPRGFGNLPGLILELDIRKHKYAAVSIDFKPKKDIKITRPTKGKKKDYNEFLSGQKPTYTN